MNKIVLKTITDNAMISPGDHIIVALSGGADSVCLLHILLSLRDELSITIGAAHINHRLRGEESWRDEDFVRTLCKRLGVELYLKDCDVKRLAEERKQSEELCGREVRYEFFAELATEHDAKIATAHTLSDSEETMLYNIARGCGLHGLCSIPYRRDHIIRPLLDVTRAEVEEYLEKNGISYVDDSTNFDEELCSRNRIRHKVLPPLKALNKGFDGNFSRLRSRLSDIDRYMMGEAESIISECRSRYGLDARRLAKCDPALLSYVLIKYISEYGVAAESKHIILCENIIRTGGAVMINNDLTAICAQGVFRINNGVDDEFFDEIPIDGSTPSLNFIYSGKEYGIEVTDKSQSVNKKFSKNVIKCDIIQSGTVIRRRKEGDTFSLPYRNITKPLRKLQNELKIPRELRDSSLLIACDNTVLWDENAGVSLRGMGHDDCKYQIIIEVKRRG